MTYDHAPTAALATAISTAYLTPGRTASIGTGQFARTVIDALNNLGYTLTPTGQTPDNPTQPHTDLITPREAADAYGVTETTVAYWADRGHLSCLRTPGGHRRYLRSEVDAWLAAGTRQTVSPAVTVDLLAPTDDVSAVLDAPDA